ncbi:MAG: hypothetical protein IBX63_00065 [Coriobacteriia bacterium]|nr:hypothetical protein [Coriobacteriia bacterium]
MAADTTRERQQYALQTIFSFFLGLMVLAFIGIGVNTFYPQPEYRENPEIRELYREQEQIWNKNREGDLSDADQAKVDEIQEQIDALQAGDEEVRQVWSRNTSIILIIFATAVMGISLVRSEQLRVISNGLLLGGLFTMVYGVGWIIASGESIARFGVIVFALAVTMALGYLKFVRGKEVPIPAVAVVVGSGGEVDAAALSPLVARIEALEARTEAAAAALGTHKEHEA